MVTLQEKAWAKVNLTLDVLGKRPDGYHDLKSIMQTVSLYDVIEMDIGTGKAWEVHCDQEGIPCDHRNLVWKAAQAFCETLGKDPDGLVIRIEKHIPSGAGMGGGSADAAAVLRILNRYYGDPLSYEALAAVGAAVGSDVPFCVVGGTVMCEGRGERLRPLPAMPRCWMVGCKPEFSISTPVLYRKLDEAQIVSRPDNDAMEQAICQGDIVRIAENIRNVFEPVVSSDYPQIEQIKAVCRSHGALGVQMTGSGSVVFAIMPDESSAVAAREALAKLAPDAFVANPV